MKTYPTPITFLPLHPPRPGVLRRLARWACRPLKTWLLLHDIGETDRNIALFSYREWAYNQAHHDFGARQMRALADAERTKLARLWLEMDELERGESNQ